MRLAPGKFCPFKFPISFASLIAICCFSQASVSAQDFLICASPRRGDSVVSPLHFTIPANTKSQLLNTTELRCNGGGGPTEVIKNSANIHKNKERELQQIMYQLAGDDLKSFTGTVASIKLHESPELNAYSLKNGQIILTSAIVNLTESRDELAFLIAHELGHISLGHTKRGKHSLSVTGTSPPWKDELEADKFAYKLLQTEGFISSAGSSILQRIYNIQAMEFLINSRPLTGLNDRIQALDALS